MEVEVGAEVVEVGATVQLMVMLSKTKYVAGECGLWGGGGDCVAFIVLILVIITDINNNIHELKDDARKLGTACSPHPVAVHRLPLHSYRGLAEERGKRGWTVTGHWDILPGS